MKGGLVAGDYGASDESDGEAPTEPAEKPVQTAKDVPPSRHLCAAQDRTLWSVLYDQATGYPYYWNQQTNEVRWDKPPELEETSRPGEQERSDCTADAKVGLRVCIFGYQCSL